MLQPEFSLIGVEHSFFRRIPWGYQRGIKAGNKKTISNQSSIY